MFDNIVTAIEGILPVSGAGKLIQSFYNFEASNIEGSPCAMLTPSDNEAEYTTTTENERVYAFSLKLLVDRKKGTDNERTSENTLRELADSVIDDLDKNYRLSGLASKTGYTMLFMEAMPSLWGYVGADEIYRYAEIIIKVHLSVDVNTIS